LKKNETIVYLDSYLKHKKRTAKEKKRENPDERPTSPKKMYIFSLSLKVFVCLFVKEKNSNRIN
jgi:hypothetical protein